MNRHEVRFIGGPVDGTLLAFPNSEPPEQLDVTTWPEDRSGGPLTFWYRRQPNPLNDGPAWLMVPVDPNYTDPFRPSAGR